MSRHETLKRIVQTGIVPVVRARSGEEALGAIDAIRAGGIDVMEITMTVPGAIDIVRELVRKFKDDVALGVGTVLDAETARACILAGAQFVVTPIVDSPTMACCRTYSVPVLAGALTPTEVVAAWRAGADMVKVFPCNSVGGASYVKALKAPLPQIDLVPTGGVSLSNVGDFIQAGAIAVGAGADLVDLAKLRAGQAGAITERARGYVQAIQKARAHAPD